MRLLDEHENKKNKKIDLGVPGGYDQFNHKFAFKLGEMAKLIELDIREQMKEGIIRIMDQGETLESHA